MSRRDRITGAEAVSRLVRQWSLTPELATQLIVDAQAGRGLDRLGVGVIGTIDWQRFEAWLTANDKAKRQRNAGGPNFKHDWEGGMIELAGICFDMDQRDITKTFLTKRLKAWF